MGGEAIDVRCRESFEELDMEMLGLQNFVVEELTPVQVKRVIEIADIIIAEDPRNIVFRQRLEAALLVAKIGDHYSGTMNDSEKLSMVQMLTDLNFADEREFDNFELPMVLEVAEAQEMLALSIKAEVVDGVDIEFEVLENIQAVVASLSEKADEQFDGARGNIEYPGMDTDDGDDIDTGDIRDEIVSDIEDDLDGIF